MSNPFRPANKTNPCPVCGDTTRRCRRKLTRFDLPGGQTIEAEQFFCVSCRDDLPGFKYSGETDGYRWGKYITQELSEELSLIWSDYTRQHPQNAKSRKLKLKPKKSSRYPVTRVPELVSYKHLLGAEHRDREIRKLLAQLSLKPKHIWALSRRGLSQLQIERCCCRSVTNFQSIAKPVNDRLAGIAPGGMSLNSNYAGLLIPIRNPLGQYIGWQVRLDFTKNSCYVWASGETTSVHLPDSGELPLGFFLPQHQAKSNYIGLVEGLGFKGIVTSDRYSQVILGASGGQFASSPQQFKQYLQAASKLTQRKILLLYPDAGSILNRLILIQYWHTVALATEYGYQVKVAWWGQITKGCSDVDEHHFGFNIISPNEFWAIAKKFIKYRKVNQHENKNQASKTFDCPTASL